MFVRVASPRSSSAFFISRHGALLTCCVASFLLGLLAASGGGSRRPLKLWSRSDGVSGNPASSVVPAPSLATFQRIQADPGLLTGRVAADMVSEFEAAPWLLPPHTPTLPYAGLHDLDQLLTLRARPLGDGARSGVALLLFNKRFAVMAQNSIYSLVKLAGVRNYIVLTWTAEDLEACADLNLPCADVSSLLAMPLSDADQLTRQDFAAMSWIKAAAVLHVLGKELVVMLADTDVAYTKKALWDSYLAFIDAAGADGAWQQELPLNTGHFVLLPTPASLAFARRWNKTAPAMTKRSFTDQFGLRHQQAGGHIANCSSLCSCFAEGRRLKQERKRKQVALFRAYLPSHFMYTYLGCTVGAPQWMPRLDPCDWSVLYVHPICTKAADPTGPGTSLGSKEATLRAAGFWFMDNPEGCKPQAGAASQVPACRPLQWRVPETEAAHFSCHSFSLGLVHGGEPAAARKLRKGVDAEEAQRLLDVGNSC